MRNTLGGAGKGVAPTCNPRDMYGYVNSTISLLCEQYYIVVQDLHFVFDTRDLKTWVPKNQVGCQHSVCCVSFESFNFFLNS